MTGTQGPQPPGPGHRKVHLGDGHQFENWQVVSHLADGGTSSVYRVRYTGIRVNEFPTDAALKITPISGPAAAQLLIDEYEKARTVAGEPNVVRALDAFRTDTPDAGPCVVIVHELGDESLADCLRRVQKLEGAALRRLQDDLIEGIVSLHRAKLVHSDIKPANILRFDTVWKLADLETAANVGPMTSAPLIGATPSYAPPDLHHTPVAGDSPRVRRSVDLWSLGVVLHEAATGESPFPDAESWRQGRPVIHPDIPDETRNVIARCLVPRAQRLGTGMDLEALVAGSRAEATPGRLSSSAPHRWPYVAAAAFAALSIVLLALQLFGNGNPDGPLAGPGGASGDTTPAAALAAPACPAGSDGLSLRFVNSELLGKNGRDVAAQVAVDEVNAVNDGNGRPPVNFAETTTPNQLTPDELTDLLGACPDALITNIGSEASLKILPDVTTAGVIEISVNATSPLLDDADTAGLNFTTAPSDAIQGRLLARQLKQAGKTKAAVIYLDDAYGAALKEEFEQNFEGGEAKPRVVAEYRFGLQDVVDQAAIAEVVKAGPDAIVIIAFDEQSADVAGILGDLAYDFGSVWLVDGNPRVTDYLGDRSDLLEGAHQITVGAEASGTALTNLRTKLAVTPGDRLEAYDAQAYDAIIIVALAAAAANSTDSAAVAAQIVGVTTAGQKCGTYAECIQLIDSGQNIDYDGVGGPYELTENGRPFEALYYVDTMGPDGLPDLQRSELRAETLCEICEANNESLRISFQPNSAEVAPEFDAALQTIAGIITSSQAKEVLVEGYASPEGGPEVNCPLSAARAQAVHDILVNEHGIPDERLTPVGLCATDQLIENRTVLFTEPR